MTEAMEQQLRDFFDESKAHRLLVDESVKEIKNQILNIQLALAEERGKNVPARIQQIEHELDMLRTFRDSISGSINSLRWILGVGLTFLSSLIVGLIILIVRDMIIK